MGFISNMNRALELDEKAKTNTGKAYEAIETAKLRRQEQEKNLEKALTKLINRKKGIIQSSISDFLEVYQKIMKINFIESDGIKELSSATTVAMVEEFSDLKAAVLTAKDNGNDVAYFLLGAVKDATVTTIGAAALGSFITKQTVGQFVKGELAAILGGPVGLAIATASVVTGLSKSILEDSEREARCARNLLRQSETIKEQSELEISAMEAIIQRANRIAEVLSKLNLLFVKNLMVTKKIIEKNGSDRSLYSKEEINDLQVCINLACAIKDLLDTALFDAEGNLTKKSMEAILVGQEYFEKMNAVLNA